MIYTAIVEDINDPMNLSRLRVRIHGFRQDANKTPWVNICSLFAGPDYGVLFVPQVGDEVLVSMTVDHDWVCLGAIWSDRNPKPVDASSDIRVIKTPVGHQIKFEEKGSIEIKHSAGNSITLLSNGDISFNVSEINKINLGGSSIEAALLGESFQTKFNDLVDKFNKHDHSYDKPQHSAGPGTTGNSSEQAEASDSNELSKKVILE